MKIYFNTNLDNYTSKMFPENLKFVPRVGEKIIVTSCYHDFFNKQHLPIRLEVVDVTHTESGVCCELNYNKLDCEIINKINA